VGKVDPLMLGMWPNKLKMDEEKSKHVILAQENSFGLAFFHKILRLVKGTTKLDQYDLSAMQSVPNKYDLSGAPCF